MVHKLILAYLLRLANRRVPVATNTARSSNTTENPILKEVSSLSFMFPSPQRNMNYKYTLNKFEESIFVPTSSTKAIMHF